MLFSRSGDGGASTRFMLAPAPSQRTSWSISTETESRLIAPCGSVVRFTIRLVWYAMFSVFRVVPPLVGAGLGPEGGRFEAVPGTPPATCPGDEMSSVFCEVVI